MTQPLTQRRILLFWAPLAATWVMMATEGPFLAAIIARLADPKFNLAAHGVAFAFAILIEAPVIMLMSAATALVRDKQSFRRLRNFAHGLNALGTVLLLIILIPGIYRSVMIDLIRLPDEVARLTYGALWIFLPWPGAIGYRRFLQGVLIRSGRTRLVAYGTVIRLIAMSITALGAYFLMDIPGAWVGAMSLSVGVSVEAVAAHFMAGPATRDLPDRAVDAGEPLSYRAITAFYYPLALTSLIGLTVQPMLTFFMGRSVAPVDSLAVFPVVAALSFLFRAPGMAFQDASIALMGDRFENLPELARFGRRLGIATFTGVSLVVFTPLAAVWFQGVSGLTPDLAAFALTPAQISVVLPPLTVMLSFQRGILVTGRRTRGITVATGIEVAVIAVTFSVLGWSFGWVGVTAAFASFALGRFASNIFLATRWRPIVASVSEDKELVKQLA